MSCHRVGYIPSGAKVVGVLEQLVDIRGLPETITMKLIGRLSDECVNINCFTNMKHARDVTKESHRYYNEVRPHSFPCGLTPREFVENTGKTLTAIGL